MPINHDRERAFKNRQGAATLKHLDPTGGRMSNAKETVRKMLNEIPEESSLQDIQYHIYVLEKIEKGLYDAKDTKVLSQAEVKKRMSKWLGK